MSYTNSLSVALQKEGTNLLAALESARASLQCIQGEISEAFFSRLYIEITALAQIAGISELIPRRVGRQTQRDNIPASTLEEYWRTTVYYVFIDHLQDELKIRLLNHDLEDRLLVEKLLPQTVQGLDDVKLAELSSKLVKTYDQDLPYPSHSLHEMKRKNTCAHRSYLTVDEALLAANVHFYPNVHILFKLHLVLPISTATAEKTFSSLRILKTQLRSTMAEDLIVSKDIIEKWYNLCDKRIQLSFDPLLFALVFV